MKKNILLAALSIFFFACESEDAVLEESLLKEVNVKSPTLVDIGSTTHSISLNKAKTSKISKKTFLVVENDDFALLVTICSKNWVYGLKK